MKTTWVTFYSYKGGVGRSMALANVAALMAREGRRIVMIDFDLEAPGLDSFEAFGHSRRPGVVEYLHQFLHEKRTPPIEHFVHTCPVNERIDGRLWLMPSGCKDEQYPSRLHQIDWARMYKDQIAQPLIANWKAAIERVYAPDYVFIDSRTGLTDVGGVCTLHFPDIVVLFFALNAQNIEGTSAVLRTITHAAAARPIDVLTVASPIPNLTRESSSIGDRIAEAERQLGGKLTSAIGYFAPVSLKEHLWALEENGVQPAIIPAYETLATKITQRVRDGIDFHLGQAREIIRTGDLDSAPSVTRALLSEYPDWLAALRAAAQLLRLQGEKAHSIDVARSILKLDPSDRESFQWVVTHYKSERRLPELRAFLSDEFERMAISHSVGKMAVLGEIGHAYMQLKEYAHAAASYVKSSQCAPPGGTTVPFRFNFLEAKRRERGAVTQDAPEWSALCVDASEMLENILQLRSDRDYVTSANNFQALSVAFAVAGDMRRAQELLLRAELEARLLNPNVRLFSVVDYDNVERDVFLAQVELMLRSLQEGKLWDGMVLPLRSPV